MPPASPRQKPARAGVPTHSGAQRTQQQPQRPCACPQQQARQMRLRQGFEKTPDQLGKIVRPQGNACHGWQLAHHDVERQRIGKAAQNRPGNERCQKVGPENGRQHKQQASQAHQRVAACQPIGCHHRGKNGCGRRCGRNNRIAAGATNGIHPQPDKRRHDGMRRWHPRNGRIRHRLRQQHAGNHQRCHNRGQRMVGAGVLM